MKPCLSFSLLSALRGASNISQCKCFHISGSDPLKRFIELYVTPIKSYLRYVIKDLIGLRSVYCELILKTIFSSSSFGISEYQFYVVLKIFIKIEAYLRS